MTENASQLVRLAYTAHGDSRMPAILLIPGMASPSSLWPEPFVRELVRAGFYVVCVENRDVGLSTHIETTEKTDGPLVSIVRYLFGCSVKAPYSIDDMARDVQALMLSLRLDRVHVVGISMGGMIAQALACMSSENIISMTCISSATGNPKTGLGSFSAIGQLLSLTKRPTGQDGEEVKQLNRTLTALSEKGRVYTTDEMKQISEEMKRRYITEETFRRHLLAILAGGNRCKKLQQLEIPTLIIHGKEDKLLPEKAGREIAECIDRAKFLKLDHMGHNLPNAGLDRITKAIIEHCYQSGLR